MYVIQFVCTVQYTERPALLATRELTEIIFRCICISSPLSEYLQTVNNLRESIHLRVCDTHTRTHIHTNYQLKHPTKHNYTHTRTKDIETDTPPIKQFFPLRPSFHQEYLRKA